MDNEREEILRRIESNIGINFANIRLLDIALTHSSYGNELGEEHNERMEFLGDCVLGFIVGSHIYDKFPHLTEGELTQFRSNIVCSKSLANAAKKLQYGDALLFGHGEEMCGGKNRQSNLEDAFEAVLGAIFLDKGIDVAREFVLKIFEKDFADEKHYQPVEDFKSRLIEKVQSEKGREIEFILLDEWGPPHDKRFSAAAKIDGKIVGRGEGKSKKAAEQLAAAMALKKAKI